MRYIGRHSVRGWSCVIERRAQLWQFGLIQMSHFGLDIAIHGSFWTIIFLTEWRFPMMMVPMVAMMSGRRRVGHGRASSFYDVMR